MVETNVWNILAQQFTVMTGLLFVLEACVGDLVVGPTDVSTEINKTVTLECTSNANTFVKWKHCLVDNSDCNIINYKKKLVTQYSARFSINKGCASGICTLTIRDVQERDVGEYCCVDIDGAGEMNCAQLTIITDMQCWNDAPDGAISGTSCGIPPDKVQHTCRVHYEGQTPPTIVWTDEAGRTIHNSHQLAKNQANVVSSKIKLEATASGIGAECRVKFSDVSCASKYQSYYAYNSSDIIVLSAGSINCYINSSGPCNMTWHLAGFADFSDNNLILNFSSGVYVPGEYVCSASCNVKSEPCYVRGSTVMFDPIAKCDYSWCYVLLSIFIVVALVIAIFIVRILVYLCCFDGKNTKLWRYLTCQEKHSISTEEGEIVFEALIPDSVVSTNQPIAIFESTLYGEVKIRGITVIDNFMYFICNGLISVEKYDLEKGKKVDPIVVPQLKSPWGLTKCTNNRYIHISEYDNSEEAYIFTIDLKARSSSEKFRRWPVSKEYCRNWVRISVAKANNNVMVCGRMSSKIEVYSYDQHETKLFVIELESSVTNLQQAIQLGNSDVIFIQGWIEDKIHRVCKIDPENSKKIVKIYGNLENNNMSTPTDVVVTSHGYIYVAAHKRILILNPELQFVKEVILNSHPSRLFVDDLEDFLYIGAIGSILRLKIPLV